MSLYSLTFIFMFLPAALLLYLVTPLCKTATPMRAKNAVLLGLSLVFYLLSEPKYLLVLAAAVLVDYAAAIAIERLRKRDGICRTLLVAVVVKNLLAVVFLSSFSQNRELWQPLGLLICMITSMGFVLDVHQGTAKAGGNLLEFCLFCLLFCKLPAGPLVRWNQMESQLRSRRVTLELAGRGLGLYIQGLAKKVLIGNTMTSLYEQLRRLDQSLVSGWMMTAALAFALYFNLSSLCDMARGLAALFGFELPRNFSYPYQSRSVTEFVSRFNCTVTAFFAAYLPPPPNRLGKRLPGTPMVMHLFVLTMLWAAWFGFRVNFLIWGLYFVLFQLLELLGVSTLLEKIPALFARMYTFAVVLISFVIFAGNNVQQSLGYIGAMLGLHQPFTTSAMYLATTSYVPMLLAFLLCTSLAHNGLGWLRRQVPRTGAVVEVGLNVVLLVLSTAFLMI